FRNYAIGGAVGAAMYLEPFHTKDFDVFIAIDQKGILFDLSGIYAYLTQRGFQAEGQWIVIGEWKVEFLPPYNVLTDEALREAIMIPWDGISVRVMRPEHLVAICLETGRTKDAERIGKFIEQDAFKAETLAPILE